MQSHPFIGNWQGKKHLFLSWLPNPEHISDSTFSARPVAQGKFLQCSYTWSHEGQSHEGELLLGIDDEHSTATGGWIDSWHQSKKVMFLDGIKEASGAVNILGSFEVPPGPDWGWRIVIQMVSDEALEMKMFNISPEGEEELGVHAKYQKPA